MHKAQMAAEMASYNIMKCLYSHTVKHFRRECLECVAWNENVRRSLNHNHMLPKGQHVRVRSSCMHSTVVPKSVPQFVQHKAHIMQHTAMPTNIYYPIMYCHTKSIQYHVNLFCNITQPEAWQLLPGDGYHKSTWVRQKMPYPKTPRYGKEGKHVTKGGNVRLYRNHHKGHRHTMLAEGQNGLDADMAAVHVQLHLLVSCPAPVGLSSHNRGWMQDSVLT